MKHLNQKSVSVYSAYKELTAGLNQKYFSKTGGTTNCTRNKAMYLLTPITYTYGTSYFLIETDNTFLMLYRVGIIYFLKK